jgi:hypothetical protein
MLSITEPVVNMVLPPTAPQNANTELTDKWVPPPIITNVAPIAMIDMMTTWRTTLMRFAQVRNTSHLWKFDGFPRTVRLLCGEHNLCRPPAVCTTADDLPFPP